MKMDDLHDHLEELFESRLDLRSTEGYRFFERSIRQPREAVPRKPRSSLDRACQACGVGYRRPNRVGQPPRYCSRLCAGRARRKRRGPPVVRPILEPVPRTCLACAAPFIVCRRRGSATRRYCTVRCLRRARVLRAQTKTGRSMTGTCAGCVRVFAYEYRGRLRKFCCAKCASDARRGEPCRPSSVCMD